MKVHTGMIGATVLRAALGGLFLAHAGMKIFVFTPAGTAQFFESVGVPGFIAYLVMTAGTLGGIALLLGIYPRIVALGLLPLLLGALAQRPAENTPELQPLLSNPYAAVCLKNK